MGVFCGFFYEMGLGFSYLGVPPSPLGCGVSFFLGAGSGGGVMDGH